MALPHDFLLTRIGEKSFAIEPVVHPDDWSDEKYADRVTVQRKHRAAELTAHGVTGEAVVVVPVDDRADYLASMQVALQADIPRGEPETPIYKVLN